MTGGPRLTEAQRAFLRAETMASVAINAAVSALFVWIMFDGMASVPLWGAAGLAADLVPTIFMITFMMTNGLTLVTWRRVRRGTAPGLSWSRTDHPWLRLLPAWVPARALLLGAAALAMFWPATIGLLIASGATPMAYGWVYVFKVAYGGMLGLLVTPVILLAAMADRPVPAVPGLA